jgi:hypothetical protein
MKRFVLAAFIFLFGFFTLASAAPKVKIRFTNSDEDSREIQNTITSRLNLTERYTVVTDNTADIKVDISCVHVDSTIYRVCAETIYLWPCADAFLAFNVPWMGYGTPTYIADRAFVNIVNQTSDEGIAQMWRTFALSVKKACEAGAEACSTLSASQVH